MNIASLSQKIEKKNLEKPYKVTCSCMCFYPCDEHLSTFEWRNRLVLDVLFIPLVEGLTVYGCVFSNREIPNQWVVFLSSRGSLPGRSSYLSYTPI